MHLYQFKKQFQLELIPASHADISLCDLVWLRKKKPPLLDRKGMPNNIYNLFLTEQLLDDEEWRNSISALESEELVPAQFGWLEININRRFGLTFQHPVIQLFFSKHQFYKHIQFSFSALKVRVLSNFQRVEIQRFLDELNPIKEKKIFRRYRPVHLITELYYGNLRLSIDRSLAHNTTQLLKSNSMEKPLIEYHGDKEMIYEFSNQEVPFAMRLETLKDFRA